MKILTALVLLMTFAPMARASGSVCSQDEAVLRDHAAQALKQLAHYDASYAIDGGMDVLMQEPVSHMRSLGTQNAIKKFIMTEFNNESVMRDQVEAQLEQLAENGRNSTQDGAVFYMNRDGLYCPRMTATFSNLKIVRSNTTSIGNRVHREDLMALIKFSNGYHGGSQDITFQFAFAVQYKIGNRTPDTFDVELANYPRFLGPKCVDNGEAGGQCDR